MSFKNQTSLMFSKFLKHLKHYNCSRIRLECQGLESTSQNGILTYQMSQIWTSLINVFWIDGVFWLKDNVGLFNDKNTHGQLQGWQEIMKEIMPTMNEEIAPSNNGGIEKACGKDLKGHQVG